MSVSFRFLISALALSVIILGSVSSCEGQIAKIAVEGPTEVWVSREFTVKIWIRDLAGSMTGFSIRTEWDPNMMEVVDIDTSVEENGWTFVDGILGSDFHFLIAEGAPFNEDDSWISITFHCLGPGVSEIRIAEASLNAAASSISWEPVNLELTQFEYSTVGGVTLPTNTLAILTPYIALAVLIIVVSTVYVIRRRKD